MITAQTYKWFLETTTSVEGHMHALKRTIVQAQTKFQHMEIVETHSYGKALILDGRIQSSVADEFIYHDALVHPGMLAVDRPPEAALVIGGGEGATLREVLKYPSIRRAVMVDIDDEVVALCRQHLPEMHRGAFDDPRTEVRHEDVRNLQVQQGVLQRMMDVGGLAISSSAQEGVEIAVRDIRDPDGLAAMIRGLQ